MPLEDLTGNAYINALVNTNPTADDDRSEGDNHVRGVKNVLVKSFPQISGPVAAGHADLSACAGASSDFQPQIDGLDGRVTQNETDIVLLQQGGGGSLPPVKGVLWTNQTQITTVWTSQPLYQAVSGASMTIPSSWGVGTIKVDVSVNMLLTSAESGVGGQQHLLTADLAIALGGTPTAEFASVLGLEGWSPQLSRIQTQVLVNISVLINATGGQSISLQSRRGYQNQGSLKINNFNAQSYMTISRVLFEQ